MFELKMPLISQIVMDQISEVDANISTVQVKLNSGRNQTLSRMLTFVLELNSVYPVRASAHLSQSNASLLVISY